MQNRRRQQLIDQVRERFGDRAAITDPHDIAPWLIDWRGRFRGQADAILSPADRDAVAAMVGMAHAAGVALVPQGGNTSMVGGATPPDDGSALILSLRRLDRVRSIDPAAAIAIAEAGVILSNLHTAAEARTMRFPLTLGAKGSATVGGLVSTNAGGTQVLRWGTMRKLVAGVEAVMPDGSVHDGLAALKKDNRGYDIDQLLIGAEGTIGIVTAAALRLAPAIRARAVGWVGVASPHRALDLLRFVERRTDAIESFEIIPASGLAHVLTHIPGTRAPLSGNHAWHLLVEAVSSETEAEAPAALLERLFADALAANLIEDATIATSEARADALWRLRDSLSEAERAQGPAVQHDISVAVAAMPDFLIDAATAAMARYPGTHATGFGHLGDGNVHFHVRAPAGVDRDKWYADEAPGITRFVHDLVVASGGSISAEHGIGQMKRDELARLGPPSRMAALTAIKRAFDPSNLMNPGKLVTLAPSRGDQ